MDIISFIKKHRLYKYVKENNGLIAFLLTVLGTLSTLFVRGMSYLYHAGRLTTFDIPKSIVSNSTPYISMTVTIICALLLLISLGFSFLFIYAFYKLKKIFKQKSKKRIALEIVVLLFTSIGTLTIINYYFVLIQNLQTKNICLFALLLSLGEILVVELYYKDIIEYKKGDLIVKGVVAIFMVAIVFGTVYKSGCNSTTSPNVTYQIIAADNKEYTVLETYDDKYVIAECTEDNNKLTIHTDKQRVISYENVEYENKKFKSIVLEGNK